MQLTISKVNKSQLRKHSIKTMFEQRPEFANNITSKLLDEALIYIRGYMDAHIKELTPPINKKEIESLQLSLGFDYIFNEMSA